MIINTETEDCHIHSLNFSDGFATIDEIARYAGSIGLTKIVITDHSQAAIEANQLSRKSNRAIMPRWKNVHNNVEVLFGVEADLLDETGNVCFDIQGIQGDFNILSFHNAVFKGDKSKVTEGFLRAIERYHDKIKMIGHLNCNFGLSIDHDRIIEAANEKGVALEINGRYLDRSPEVVDAIIRKAANIYVNSDAHTLSELRDLGKSAWKLILGHEE